MHKRIRFGKRGWVVGTLALVAVPLVTAALAYGCTAVATLALTPSSGAPGDVVTVNGKGFGTHDPADAGTNGNVELRLGSVSGPVLATASPTGSDRAFSVQLTVPETTAGDTFVTATQKTATGTNVFGTPARQAFTVVARAPRSSGMTSSGQVVSGASTVAPTTTSTNTVSNTSASARAKAIAACKRKYSTRKVKSHKSKKAMLKKQAACIKAASKK
jgi:hypothetical protein